MDKQKREKIKEKFEAISSGADHKILKEKFQRETIGKLHKIKGGIHEWDEEEEDRTGENAENEQYSEGVEETDYSNENSEFDQASDKVYFPS